MTSSSKGLGKGLGALLGDNFMDAQEGKERLFLPISQVESWPIPSASTAYSSR